MHICIDMAKNSKKKCINYIQKFNNLLTYIQVYIHIKCRIDLMQWEYVKVPRDNMCSWKIIIC